MDQPRKGKSQKNVIAGNVSNSGNLHIGDITHYSSGPKPPPPKELTLSLPRTHSNDIIGREADLTQLHDSLHTQKRVVVVNGLGGIGKTTLTQAYISRYYDHYHHIAWITQDSDNIAGDFINTAGLIKSLDIDTAKLDTQQLFEEIIRQLKAIGSSPNLLVIDNGEQSLQRYIHQLPGQPHWHLLVTSREAITGFHTQTLDFLDKGQAIALFKKHYTHRQFSDTDIEGLVAGVDFHTLTIEMLAKTAEVQRYDIATLRQVIEQDLRANIEIAHNRETGKVEKIGSYLQAVFTLSRLEAEEIWLLKQFTCLPSEFHPYTLVRGLILNEESDHAAALSETLTQLAKKGWLLYDSPTESYKMHRVVADVIRKEQAIYYRDIEELVKKTIEKLSVGETGDNPVDKFFWIPFGKAVLAGCQEETPYQLQINRLQDILAARLMDQGDYHAAKLLIEKCIDVLDEDSWIDKIVAMHRFTTLAHIQIHLGQYTKAKTILKTVLQSRENLFGPDNPSTIESYSNLAVVLQEQGDNVTAKTLFEKAIRGAEKNLGPYHPTALTYYANLAMALRALGKYSEAKILLENIMQVAEKNFEPGHPRITLCYSHLATVLYYLGDLSKAKDLFEKAIRFDDRNFGPDHPTTATHYAMLAEVLQGLGDHSRALTLAKTAWDIFKKAYPPKHPYTKHAKNIYLSIKNNPPGPTTRPRRSNYHP